jgi:hypothetical protein
MSWLATFNFKKYWPDLIVAYPLDSLYTKDINHQKGIERKTEIL